MLGLNWLKRKKVRKLRERIDYLKRQVSPFHQVLSTIRAEGKNDYLARLVLKDIQDRERKIACLDGHCRKLEGIK